jgi:hypothetical protein
MFEEPLPLSQIKQLRFVLTPATEQVAQVRRLLSRLGAASYQDREEAQKELLDRGARFLEIFRQTLPRTTDFEVRWRLKEIIETFEKRGDEPELLGNDYDELRLNGDQTSELHGDVGNWTIETEYRGVKLTLTRANVLSLRNDTIRLDLLAEPPVVSVERIPNDEDELFPAEVTRIDFDRGPRGEAIPAGTNISETYVPLGAIFSSSFKESYVAIEPYNVGGRSGGRCAATHNPLYQGILTVRFCKPGNARIPAGVKCVGFWTSHIAPDGTALQAFDAGGRRLAEIKTVRSQRDFLAIRTNIPIAYIRVVPDEDIDPDFAIDDLVFDTPKTLSEAGDPDHYSVVLRSGERLHSTSLEVQSDQLILKDLTIGIPEMRIPTDELAVLVPPHNMPPDVGQEPRCFVRTADGSVFRARSDGGLKLDRFAELPIDANRLVALWGAETILEEPAEDAWPAEGAVMIVGHDDYVRLSQWKLGDAWIEADFQGDPGSHTYANSPVVWFRKAEQREKESGLLRTTVGEEIVLGTPDGFSLKSWSLEGVTVARGDKDWMIGMGEVQSLLLPRPKP